MTAAAVEIVEARELDAAPPGAAAPEWIMLLPAPDAAGLIHCRDGRRFWLPDPAALIARFEAHGGPVALDIGHAMDRPERAGTVEAERAAGWLAAMELRDGALWGRVEWTQAAAELIGRRELRFFSPSMEIDPATKRVLRIVGGGLVARPALKMTALATAAPPPGRTTATAAERHDPAAQLARALSIDPARLSD